MATTTTPNPTGSPPATGAARTTTEAPPPAPLLLGARDITPLAASVIPFGLAIGATIAGSDLPAGPALSGSVLILAGAAQLAAIDVLAAGGGIGLAVATALMINARLVMYSGALVHWFDGLPRWRRLLLAAPIIDQTFAICERRFAAVSSSPRWRERYYLGATAVIAGGFVVAQIVGYAIGAELPSGLGLHLAAPLAFAGLVGSATRTRPAMVAAVTAAAAVVGLAWLPAGLSLPVAVIAAIAVASRTTETETDAGNGTDTGAGAGNGPTEARS